MARKKVIDMNECINEYSGSYLMYKALSDVIDELCKTISPKIHEINERKRKKQA